MTNHDTLRIVFPTQSHQALCEAFIKEVKTHDNDFQATTGLENMAFDAWLARIKNYRRGLDLPKGFVPATTFLAIDNGWLVGFVSIRHELNPFLAHIGGHIGYMVHPEHRRKGYATKMLSLALDYVRDACNLKAVLITCDQANEASKKTIIKNGGVYEKTIHDHKHGIVEHYWVRF